MRDMLFGYCLTEKEKMTSDYWEDYASEFFVIVKVRAKKEKAICLSRQLFLLKEKDNSFIVHEYG